MPYHRIAVGTDGSATAAIAEKVAGQLAKAIDAELMIVTVTDSEDTDAAAILRDAEARAGQLGVTPTTKTLSGDAASGIMEAAEEGRADLVVVGDRGMGEVRRFSLGAIPDQVAHSSPVDMLVVRTTRPEARERAASYRRVLIATDGSFTAYQAAGRGFALASALGAEITLVYVGDELIGDIVLRDTAQRFGDEGIGRRVLKGKPSERIINLAADEAHDLVVVGNKGMQARRRLMRQVVPDQLAHRASCDVLISKTVGRSLHDLQPGEGGIIDVGGQKVAAFFDDQGNIYTVSARCQHLGCTVGWNSRTRTWDCPCHGSRYDYKGAVLNGPTTKPLPPVDVANL
ncbi:MAG TPA: universal stress protein [Acidimicrobiia bacterium]|nr:universal stress protein [Acidimicrobiia bacterium]